MYCGVFTTESLVSLLDITSDPPLTHFPLTVQLPISGVHYTLFRQRYTNLHREWWEGYFCWQKLIDQI